MAQLGTLRFIKIIAFLLAGISFFLVTNYNFKQFAESQPSSLREDFKTKVLDSQPAISSQMAQFKARFAELKSFLTQVQLDSSR
ncbi:MAG: hypothetical protein HY602_01635 [Parcubacteria group bacterium]|nr:hypothetical protein [Parcubacteria group bacterium]